MALDYHPKDRFSLSADGIDDPLYGHGFTINAHNRRTRDAEIVERRYGYINQHNAERGMEAAWQRWVRFFGKRLVD